MQSRPLALAKSLRSRLTAESRLDRARIHTRLPAAILIGGFLAYTLLFALTGSFVDEDEKLAVGVFASEGWMPYRDVLLNHGPLPYMLASLGYKAGGSVGSLIALRALPILLSLISILSIRRGPMFKTGSYALLARVAWTTLLALLWSQGTLRMGIYHGLGGLTACILIGQCLAPLQIGNRLADNQQLKTICLALLMITESLTFVPYATLSMLAVFIGMRAATKRKSARSSGRQTSRLRPLRIWKKRLKPSGQLYKYIALAAACSPLASIVALAACNTIPLRSIYLGHIYFNINIFSKLNPTISITRIPELSISPILCAALLCAVLLVPFCATRSISESLVEVGTKSVEGENDKDGARNKRIYLYLSAILTSASILSLGYRTGYLAMNDFHSLPYFTPALYILNIYGSRFLEASSLKQRWNNIPATGLARPVIGLLTVFLPLVAVGWFRLSSKSIIQVDTNIHYTIGKKNSKTEFVDKIIKIVEFRRGRRATIFGWPFTPWIYPIYNRASSFGLTGFLWYNDLVEKDKELSKYRVCNRAQEQYPDIIIYGRWVVGSHDSDKYGGCLVRLQRDYYYKIAEDIYILKAHKPILAQLRGDPEYADFFQKPNWKLMPENSRLVPLEIPVNGRTALRINRKATQNDDSLGVMFGTYGRVNAGTLRICILGREGQRLCSAPISKRTLMDNSVKHFVMRGLKRLPPSSNDTLEITDETNRITNSQNHQIAIYVLISDRKKVAKANEVATWSYFKI